MYRIKKLTPYIIALFLAGIFAYWYNERYATATQQYGNLVLTEWGTANECVIAIDEKWVSKGDGINGQKQNIPGCQFKFFDKIQLRNVPSALTLRFDSFWASDDLWQGGCNKSVFIYRVTIKTAKAMDQSPQFSIQDALAAQPDQPIAPGIRLLAKELQNQQDPAKPIEQAFACVHISPSA